MKLEKLMITAAAGAIAMVASAQAQNFDLDVDAINASLAAQGIHAELAYAEIYSIDPDEGEQVRTIFFNNRGNKQLNNQFVVNDDRRSDWSGDPNTVDWSYSNFAFLQTGDVSIAAQRNAIYNAMQTWDDQKCSDPGINGRDVADSGPTVGLSVTADIMHSGFLPPNFVDILIPGGSGSVLGVHFGYLFIDDITGDPTDIDGNGLFDKAFGDIYYNDGFMWDTAGGSFDIETVALHESGHGFSQQHFGSAFRTESNGKIHFNPRSVMNAAYSGVQHELKGTDNAGHCSLWAQWPNN